MPDSDQHSESDGDRRLRRDVLATGGALAMMTLSGCGIIGGDDGGQGNIEELSASEQDTIVATPEGSGITASVRGVRHQPGANRAEVEGAISVPRELNYQVRLGVIDENDVVLAQSVTEELLYPTGTNLVTSAFDVPDCDACHSGLVEVRLTDRAQQQLQEEQQQEQQQQQEPQGEQPPPQPDQSGGSVSGGGSNGQQQQGTSNESGGSGAGDNESGN